MSDSSLAGGLLEGLHFEQERLVKSTSFSLFWRNRDSGEGWGLALVVFLFKRVRRETTVHSTL